MMAQGRTRLKVWLALAGVFVLGGVMGAALAGAYHLHHFDERPDGRGHGEAFFERMRSDLNLTDEQSTQIRAIINDTRNQFQTLRVEARPRFDAIKQKERERIRSILNPQQQQHFDQITARHDAMREQRDRDER